jgi:hypothetical protein
MWMVAVRFFRKRAPSFGVLLLVAAFVGLPGPARSSLTAPTLMLASVESEAGHDGGPLVRVTGEFPFSDLIQGDYPFQLFIRQLEPGTRFLCFSVRWGPMEGDHPLVEKGLDEKEALELGSFAQPTADARFLSLAPGRIEVQLPEDWPTGPAEAQLFVIYEGSPLFSNPLPFEVEEETP